MTPTRIVFLDRDTLRPETRLRAPVFPAEITCHARTAPDEVAGHIAEAEIVITNKVPLRAAALEAAPKLRHIAIAATGYDVVDLDACRARGISVSNIRAYAGATLPEHTFALILALQRSIVPYRQSVLDGRWEEAGGFCYFDHPIATLEGKQLGLIGDGVLGQQVARLGRAFGMSPVFSSYEGYEQQQIGALLREDGDRPRYAPLAEILRGSDVISLHCPLMPSTRNMISDAEFAQMDRRPLLINTARGGLVDEDALERALDAGLISGAGFDVATQEPPGADHVMLRVARHPNVILTPHVAWAATEAVQALADQLIDNIDAFHRGRPRNLVA